MRTQKTSRLIWLPTGGHIGDAVMVMSLFAEIIHARPDIQILYLVRRNAPFIADLARKYPAVTVIPVPYAPLGALFAVLPVLLRRSAVIVPPAWGVHPRILKLLAVLCVLRGDRVVGFKDKAAWQPYSALIKHDKDKRYIDNLRCAAALVSLPTSPLGTAPRLQLVTALPSDFPFAEKPYIVIHPFPHMSTAKTLPLRRWVHLVQELRLAHPAHGIVITGAEVDRVQAEEIAAAVDGGIFCAIDCPLSEVAGLIEHARLYIGVDTGPTHIAGVLGAPSVVLAQQNEPMWLPTYNSNAALISEKKNCVCGIPGKICAVWEEGHPYRRCVYDISDETILSAVSEKLHRDH
jgi:ADP-heptose:LPS heptosyltransferase